MRTRHSSLWTVDSSTSSPCAARIINAPLSALCCSSVRTRAPVSILLSFKTGPEIERWIVVCPGMRYRSLASACNARQPQIEGVVVEKALSGQRRSGHNLCMPLSCQWCSIVEAQQASEGARGGRTANQGSRRANGVTVAKEWYAVVFTARQAPAPRGQSCERASVTVTASNEGRSERKGSHEASLWFVCVYWLCLPTALLKARPHAAAELLLRPVKKQRHERQASKQ